MTIEEAKYEKKALEHAIYELLEAFHKKTGVFVDGISIMRCETIGIDGRQETIMGQVLVTTRL